MLEEIETDVADGKVCIRPPAPVSNDRGSPGVLFEEVGFAVDSPPEEAGFEFALGRGDDQSMLAGVQK
jgi:hypothetical protein